MQKFKSFFVVAYTAAGSSNSDSAQRTAGFCRAVLMYRLCIEAVCAFFAVCSLCAVRIFCTGCTFCARCPVLFYRCAKKLARFKFFFLKRSLSVRCV